MWIDMENKRRMPRKKKEKRTKRKRKEKREAKNATERASIMAIGYDIMEFSHHVFG